jgi:hypothetical protein
MSHELSSLTLEDCETLSSAPDILTYGSSDVKSLSTNGIESLTTNPFTIRPLTTSEIGSLTAGSLTGGTIGPYIYTTNNTTGINSVQPGNFSISNTKFEQNGKMVMKGAEADIEINGKSMSAWMEQIEQRLNILTPNPDMEKEWDQLRRLGERYRKLEKKCQEKSQMWNALKKMPPLKL